MQDLSVRGTFAFILICTVCSDAQCRIGPSFSCSQENDAVASLICSDNKLAEMDFVFAQAFFAYRQSLRLTFGDDGGKRANKEDGVFLNSVRVKCSLPPPTKDSQDSQEFRDAKSCVYAAYKEQRDVWMSALSGPAREEASRAPRQHIALQERLRELGYLPKTAIIDGIYGPATRNAILGWQKANSLAETGFISETDAQRLLAQAPQSSATANQRPSAPTEPPTKEAPPPGRWMSPKKHNDPCGATTGNEAYCTGAP